MFGRKKRRTRKEAAGAELRCSFCNKSQGAVKKLIAGPTVFICDECVHICVEIIGQDEGAGAARTGDVPSTGRSSGEWQPLVHAACVLCGLPVSPEEALGIEERGFLCTGCVGAVEAAIAERKPGE